MKIQNRHYQQKARQWVNRILNNKRNPLLVMPTGTGKTKTAIQIIQDRITLNKKIIILVPQIEIFLQWQNDLSDNKINYGYINDEGVIGRKKDVYLCMYQSLENILVYLPEKFCEQFNEIITDETHHSSALSYRNIYKHFSKCLRFGLTATPYRFDNQPLGEFYTDMYEPITMSEAIENGFLCRPIIYVPDEYRYHIPEQVDIDVHGINKETQKEFIHEKKIIGDMVKTYKDIFNGLPVIIPCSTHKHAEIVTEMYKNAGWNVDHIHSKLNHTDRKIIVNSVRKGITNVLVTVGVGTEGMDIPGLFGIIWMRFTESLTIYLQFCGRPARIAEGKSHYVMVDPVGVSVIHGRPDLNRKWSLETDYKPKENDNDKITMKECPVCGNMNALEVGKCWICDYDFITMLDADGNVVEGKKRKMPKFIDGRLVFLDEEIRLRGDSDDRNSSCYFNDNNNNVDNSNSFGMDENKVAPTKAEKQEILSRHLTGLKLKTKFREGLKNL